MSVFDWAFTLEQERKEEPVGAGRRVDGREPSPGLLSPQKNPHTWTCGRASEARLAGKGGQLELVGPAGLVLGVQIVEGISDRNGVYQ